MGKTEGKGRVVGNLPMGKCLTGLGENCRAIGTTVVRSKWDNIQHHMLHFQHKSNLILLPESFQVILLRLARAVGLLLLQLHLLGEVVGHFVEGTREDKQVGQDQH